jgi:mannose/fructose/N-acetylgalactosamine-specific phosphotransferase system component IIB
VVGGSVGVVNVEVATFFQDLQSCSANTAMNNQDLDSFVALKKLRFPIDDFCCSLSKLSGPIFDWLLFNQGLFGELSEVLGDVLANQDTVKDLGNFLVVIIVAADVSDAAKLVKMSPKSVATIQVGTVAKRNPGSAEDVVVESVNRRKSEIVVIRIDLESVHDRQD